ncbi:MAG: uL15 family ribosomal protein [bacterium]|nr:uL15 family ribosomal protein [bacterium]
MQLHQLKPKHKRQSRKRVGRGGKRGKTSGHGVQKLGRSQPRIREVLKRYPKLRGYRGTRGSLAVVVNVGVLEKAFAANATITLEALAKKRIVRKENGKIPQVKLLGGGTLEKSFTIEGMTVSKSAKEKITKAGGKIA